MGGRRKAGSPTQVSTVLIRGDPAPSGHHPKGWFDYEKHPTGIFFSAQDDALQTFKLQFIEIFVKE